MALALDKLEVFFEVARCGSCTGAAQRLHVTQSAVSHALQKLQEGLDCRLVERSGRSLALTDEGRLLLETCTRVFSDLDQAERRLASHGSGVEHTVVLGSTIEFGNTVLIPKLRRLLDQEPALGIDFHFSNDLVQPLLRDELDLAVDCRAHTHPSIVATRLFREKYVVVASPAFLAEHRVRTPLDLQDVPLLSLDADGVWWNNLLRAIPARRRPRLDRVVTIDHVRGLIIATVQGYGVSLVPKYAVLRELARGEVAVLFPRLRLLEDTFCVYQKRTRAAHAGNRLVTDFLRRMAVTEFGDAIGDAPHR